MGWTPLFLEMRDKKVLIVGSGEVGTRRGKRFLEAGAQVIILGKHVSPDLLDLGASIKPLEEARKWVSWADLVVVASGDVQVNEQITHLAEGKLLNRADQPDIGNVIVPSSFFIGDVQMCIFTQGKSPLMARQLRKKIEKVIKEEDVLQLELQNFTRQRLKEKVEGQKRRRTYLYQILEDDKVKKLLKEGKLEDAKLYVNQFITQKCD